MPNATQPARLARWATNGGVTIEPNEGQKDTGFTDGQIADENMTNWILNRLYVTDRFLDESRMGEEFYGTPPNWITGLAWSSGGGLNGVLGPGVAYIDGLRLQLGAAWITAAGYSPRAFLDNRDTYVGINVDRVLSFTDVANGAGAPAAPAGHTFLGFVRFTGGAFVSWTPLVATQPTLSADDILFTRGFEVGTRFATDGFDRTIDFNNVGRGCGLRWMSSATAVLGQLHVEQDGETMQLRLFGGAGTERELAIQGPSGTTDQHFSMHHRVRSVLGDACHIIGFDADASENAVRIGGGRSVPNVDPVDAIRMAVGSSGAGTTLLEILNTGLLTRILGNAEIRSNASDNRFFDLNLHRGTTAQNNSRVMFWTRQVDQVATTDRLILGSRDNLISDGENLFLITFAVATQLGVGNPTMASIAMKGASFSRNGTLVSNAPSCIFDVFDVSSSHPDAAMTWATDYDAVGLNFRLDIVGNTNLHRIFALCIGLRMPTA